MTEKKAGKEVKNIWSLITVEQLAIAIASLGNCIKTLEEETWRLSTETKLSTSLWAQVIEKLGIDHNEKYRHSLYNIWHSKNDTTKNLKERIDTLVVNENTDEINATAEVSIISESIPNLQPDASLPLPQKPKTRANKSKNANNNATKNLITGEVSFILTASEWKAAFSRTRQEMNKGWTKIFSTKMVPCGIKCAIAVKKHHIKKGERKTICKSFWCRARCTNSDCTRSYFITLRNQPDIYTSVLFHVRIYGTENHNRDKQTMACQLRGEERYLVGK